MGRIGRAPSPVLAVAALAPRAGTVRMVRDADGRTRFRVGELWTLGPF